MALLALASFAFALQTDGRARGQWAAVGYLMALMTVLDWL